MLILSSFFVACSKVEDDSTTLSFKMDFDDQNIKASTIEQYDIMDTPELSQMIQVKELLEKQGADE